MIKTIRVVRNLLKFNVLRKQPMKFGSCQDRLDYAFRNYDIV